MFRHFSYKWNSMNFQDKLNVHLIWMELAFYGEKNMVENDLDRSVFHFGQKGHIMNIIWYYGINQNLNFIEAKYRKQQCITSYENTLLWYHSKTENRSLVLLPFRQKKECGSFAKVLFMLSLQYQDCWIHYKAINMQDCSECISAERSHATM